MSAKNVTSSILNIEPIDLEYTGLKRGCLDGEVAVVTGGASNVGLGYARALAWAGAKVVVADLNEVNGAETQRVINEENGADVALFVKTNISSEEDVKNLAAKAFEKFGKVDMLINNAMNMRLNGPVLGSTINDLDMSYAISGRGVMLAIKEFVPKMVERGHGIVTYSATQFHYCPPMIGGSIYTAGKAAATSLVYVFCLTPAGVGRVDLSKMPDGKSPFAMPGFPAMIPPEVGGAALLYSLLHAEELHGSGIIMNDALVAMDYPFPVPETVSRDDGGHRLSDIELTMAFCTMGPGFRK